GICATGRTYFCGQKKRMLYLSTESDQRTYCGQGGHPWACDPLKRWRPLRVWQGGRRNGIGGKQGPKGGHGSRDILFGSRTGVPTYSRNQTWGLGKFLGDYGYDQRP